ncbi:MAG TPA: hypothetical protein VFY24_13655 [Azospira sp.]|nr:hypothetical protein [Azospira sp.]
MNDTLAANDTALTLIDLQAIRDWLATPPAPQAEDELAPLHAHLTALGEARASAELCHTVLDQLHDRTQATWQRLQPQLIGVILPLSRRIRHTVRGLQGVLLALAESYLRLPEQALAALGIPAEQITWRALNALALHLQISNYVAAPYGVGIWKLAHQTFRTALARDHAERHIPGADGTVADLYLRACLLACAQPASFTSREIGLAVDYIRRFASRAAFLAGDRLKEAEGVFWIDPDRDAPPTSAARRPAPEGALCFACERLAQLAEEQIDALEAGASVADLDLPDAAVSPAGHGVLRRLAHHWGHPGKRRFPRRRQNYRAELHIGLAALCQLYGNEPASAGETTHWLVTNESPDGYAVMHTAGKTGRLVAGDIVAISTEQHRDWQVCIVRWALSENPEHLELGLQILSRQALPALLAIPGANTEAAPRQVLVLPALPPIRPHETLVASTGTVGSCGQHMILMSERQNLEIREIRTTRLEEQTANIEVAAFEPALAG